MSNGVSLAKHGLCESCQCSTSHGPWTDAQIQEVCHELGMDQGDFGDICDDCFVAHIGQGDAVYSQSIFPRPLELKNPEYQRQLKFAAAGLALQAFREKYPDSYRQRREESAHLFQEFFEHAPTEVLEQFRAKAMELDLLPQTKYVNDAGEAVFTSQQIAEKLGIPVEQIEREVQQRFGAQLETGRVHQIH